MARRPTPPSLGTAAPPLPGVPFSPGQPATPLHVEPAPVDPVRFPASSTGSSGSDGGSAATGEPGRALVVEVEFLSPERAQVAQAGFDPNLGSFSGAVADTALQAVLQRFPPQHVAPAHSAARLHAEAENMQRLRATAAVSAAAAGELSAMERLPAAASFVHMHFAPGTPADEVVKALRSLPSVARAVRVPTAAPPEPGLPADPLIGSADGALQADPQSGLERQWYLHRMKLPQAWRLSRGAGTVIADIDWGFRTTHQELAVAIEKTHNAVDGSGNVTQGLHASHGTAVLGLAGARADGNGICGCAPEAALWAIKADSDDATGTPWAEAIDFVRVSDAQGRRKVIVLEVQTGIGGNYEQMPTVHRAVRAAIAAGCVVCVAAGNGDRRADLVDDGQPFDPTGSILVGATRFDAQGNPRAGFSNHGPRVVVCAPGDPDHDVTCAQGGDAAYTNRFGGTSGATPKVAGVVALMLTVNPALSHDEVRDILAGTGSPALTEPDKPVGVFVDAAAAVAEALRRTGATPPGLPSLPSATLFKLQGAQRRISAMQMQAPPEPGVGSPPLQAFAPPAPAAEVADRPLRQFRDTVAGTLTQSDRVLIVQQAILMLENFYVHRLLKESIHAVRPVQRLRVWLRRLQQTSDIPAAERDELAFHNQLTQIFNSVRDLHTNYLLPRPYSDYFAYLPFEVAPFVEGARTRYLVTRVMAGQVFSHPAFGPGAEVLYWNGMGIDRAVQANGEQTAGSNEAARRSRGVNALTIRAMNTTLPPGADHVDIEFVAAGADAADAAAIQRMRQDWMVRFAPQGAGNAGLAATAPAGAAAARPALSFGAEANARVRFPEARPAVASAAGAGAMAATAALGGSAAGQALSAHLAVLGVDAAADAVREARQLIFDAQALRELETAAEGDERAGISGSAAPATLEDQNVSSEVTVRVPWNLAFRARQISVGAKTLGHIHIRTFNVTDADGFVQEFVRLLGRMPETGLILDVRGNGGGSIWAAERLLQTLTAATIEPERLQFIATPGTRELCRHNDGNPHIPLGPWRASLEEAVETGSVYSRGFSVTPADSCNSVGQQYYGPVVLLVDGNCYSATDMFAAGFQDHGIGSILGVAAATGAGGANVWDHGLLTRQLPPGWGLVPLPAGAGMRVAIRQSLRVGPRAGALLEDYGVAPDRVHLPSRADLLSGERELFAVAASLLAGQALRSIAVTPLALAADDPAMRDIRIETRGLTRLDFFVDERPSASRDLQADANARATLQVQVKTGAALRLVGYGQPGDAQAAASWRGRV